MQQQQEWLRQQHAAAQQAQLNAYLASLSPEERAAYEEELRAAREATEREARDRQRREQERLEEQKRLYRERKEREQRAAEEEERQHAMRVAAVAARHTEDERAALVARREVALARVQRRVPASLVSEYHLGMQWLVLTVAGFAVGGAAAQLAEPLWFIAMLAPVWPILLLSGWGVFRRVRHRSRWRAAEELEVVGRDLDCGSWPCERCGTKRPRRWPPDSLSRYAS